MLTNVDKLLAEYRNTLVRANKTLNLVSRHGVDKIVPNLITESLFPLDWDCVKLESPLLDIGSGGGFPGIPLKLAKPELAVTLLDANRKKVLFLRQVIAKFGLTDAEAVWGRFEEFCALPENNGRYKTITSRGVGQLMPIVESARSLLADEGELILWVKASEAAAMELTGYLKPDIVTVAPGLALIRWQKE